MTENMSFVGFGQSLTVELPSNLGSPVFKRFENQELYRRTVKLNQIEMSGSAPLIPRWDGRQVWIVSHGWNSDYGGFGRDMGLRIKEANPQDIVLAIDWEDAARVTIVDTIDAPFQLGRDLGDLDNDLTAIAAVGGSFYAATWVGVVANAVAQQLAAWGVENSEVGFRPSTQVLEPETGRPILNPESELVGKHLSFLNQLLQKMNQTLTSVVSVGEYQSALVRLRK